MRTAGWAFITLAIIQIFIICVIFVNDYFGEVYGYLTFIAEFIIIGVLLIKLDDKI